MVNKVILIGRIGKDPELKSLTSGTSVVNFSLATTETWKKDGEKQERTTWLNCSAFGKTGEMIAQYFKKGDLIYVEGSIRVDKVEETYYTKIQVNSFSFLPTGKKKESAEASNEEDSSNDVPYQGSKGSDDDLPF